jgi:hypothetical protein
MNSHFFLNAAWTIDIPLQRKECSMDNRYEGGIPLLVSFLSSHDPKAQENTVTALLNLSIYERNKTKIIQYVALQPIINVLRNGCSMEFRENVVATLFNLCFVHEYSFFLISRGIMHANYSWMEHPKCVLMDLACKLQLESEALAGGHRNKKHNNIYN